VRQRDSVDESEVSPTLRCRHHLLVELASRAVGVSARAEGPVSLRVQVRHKLEVIHACHCGAYGLNVLLLIHRQHPACAPDDLRRASRARTPPLGADCRGGSVTPVGAND